MPVPPPAPGLPAQAELDSPYATLACHARPGAQVEPSYFNSLRSLAEWAAQRKDTPAPSAALLKDKRTAQGLLDARDVERIRQQQPADPIDDRPKVLVCHDFQGGLKEDPAVRGYSFEHWQLCDIFVYFSHQRVTVPPPGWIRSAHRHRTQILGTLIFEWAESVPDMALLLRGPECEHIPLPGPGRVSRLASSSDETLFSPHYADALITLALARGFDGYLINIETALELGFQCSAEAWPWWVPTRTRKREMTKNARRLRAWVSYLRLEGRRRTRELNEAESAAKGSLPPRERTWHVCWYDSVTSTTGELAWQDALTAHNRDLFEVSDSIFTNYTWAAQVAAQQQQVPGHLSAPQHAFTGPDSGGYHPSLMHSAQLAASMRRSSADVHVGIDVFGRNCWGGMDTWRSLQMIRPPERADGGMPPLSVAIFAPGWTWESKEPGRESGRSYLDWQEQEAALWGGMPSGQEAGRDKTVAAFYPSRTLELDLDRGPQSVWTSFSRGAGERWYHRGRRAYDWAAPDGDVKQTDPPPLRGCLGWTDTAVSLPQPSIELLRKAPGWAIDIDESIAWSGPCSLRVTKRASASTAAPTDLPLLSVRLSSAGSLAGKRFTIRGTTRPAAGVELECYAEARGQPGGGSFSVVEPGAGDGQVVGGWTQHATVLAFEGDGPQTITLGFRVRRGEKVNARSSSSSMSFHIGSIGISAAAGAAQVRQNVAATVGKNGYVTWEDFEPHAPFYELFAEEDGGSGKRWLGTATREFGRTEAVVAVEEGTRVTVVSPAPSSF